MIPVPSATSVSILLKSRGSCTWLPHRFPISVKRITVLSVQLCSASVCFTLCAYINAGALFISCRKASLLFWRCILIHTVLLCLPTHLLTPQSTLTTHPDEGPGRTRQCVSATNGQRESERGTKKEIKWKGKTSNQFLKLVLCVGDCRTTTQAF